MVHLVNWKHTGSLLQNALETGLLFLTVIRSMYDETICVNEVLKSLKFGEHLWLLDDKLLRRLGDFLFCHHTQEDER